MIIAASEGLCGFPISEILVQARQGPENDHVRGRLPSPRQKNIRKATRCYINFSGNEQNSILVLIGSFITLCSFPNFPCALFQNARTGGGTLLLNLFFTVLGRAKGAQSVPKLADESRSSIGIHTKDAPLPDSSSLPSSVHKDCYYTTVQSTDQEAHVHDRSEVSFTPLSGNLNAPHTYFHYVCSNGACEAADLFTPISCGDPLCLQCAKWRQKKYRKYVETRVKEVLRSHGGQLRMITLTVKSGQDLELCFDHLKDSFRELRRRDLWKKHVIGALAGYEVTYTDEGWHAHVHLLFLGDYIPQKSLKKAWVEISTDSSVVDIRKVYDFHHAMKEICKYPFKPVDAHKWSEAQKYEFRSVIHGRRLYETFGAWYGDKMKEEGGGCCPVCGWPYLLLDRLNLESKTGRSWLLGGDSFMLSDEFCSQVIPPP